MTRTRLLACATLLTTAAIATGCGPTEPQPGATATNPPAAASPGEQTGTLPAAAPAPPAAASPTQLAPANPGAGTPAPPARPSAAAPTPPAAAVAQASPAVPTPVPAVPSSIEVTVPSGTDLSIELLTDLSTETAEVEAPVRGRLRRAVTVGDRTVFPAGATVTGVVTEVDRPGRVKGRGLLALRFTSVTLDGRRVSISTARIRREGKADTRGDVTKIGGGAGIGAVVGGIVGGGGGAAKGAAIGGAAGTGAVLATRGKDVELAAGTTLTTSTTTSTTVDIPR